MVIPNRRTLVVNLFAGPGAGKSTLAAGVFFELKNLGINCEMALEYAKEKTWEKAHCVLQNQIYVFGKQHHTLTRLLDQVDVVITDSPLPLSLWYGKEESEAFKDLVMHEFSCMLNLNYFVTRVRAYNEAGRNQTEAQAREIDAGIRDGILEHYVIPYSVVPGVRASTPVLVNDILKYLGRPLQN